LQLLNTLDKARLKLTGEGTYVRAIASSGLNKTTVLLVNYDIANTNTEQVPITLTNLDPGSYTLTQTFLRYKPEVTTKDIDITGSDAKLTAIMPPNTIVSIELSKK
jgi:hypothetical protein